MSFETLGIRAVLSVSNPLVGALGYEAPHFDAPRMEIAPDRFDGRAAGMAASYGRQGPPPGGFGPSDAFALAPRYDAPPPGWVEDGSLLGPGSGVLIVTFGGGPRNTPPSILWFDFSTPPQSTPPPARAQSTAGGGLGAGLESSALDKLKGNELLDGHADAVARGIAAAPAAALAPLGLANAQAVQSSKGNLQLVPNGGMSLPNYGVQPDGALPPAGGPLPDQRSAQNDSEGGLVELEPSRKSAAIAPSIKPSEAPTTPRREQRLEDLLDRDWIHDELGGMFDTVEEFGLLDSSDLSDDHAIGAYADTQSAVAATFDDGGTIELAAGGALPSVASQDVAVARTSPKRSGQMEVTIEAGVALFQAIELGGETNGPPDAAPADQPTAAEARADAGDGSASEDEQASADEADGGVRHTAANIGLGLMALVPFSLSEKRVEKERRRLGR